MICALDNKPEVRQEIQSLADKIGRDYDTARIIYERNNGYSLDKAPNGAKSKLYQTLLEHYNGDEKKALTAKANTYLQPFFDWFGDWTDPEATNVSKVVDENGEPLVVWHGSSATFDVFDISKFGKTDKGSFGKGFYFTAQKERTAGYGNIVMPVFIDSKNPINAVENEALSFVYGSESREDAINRVIDPSDTAMSEEEKQIASEMITDELLNESKKYDGVVYNTTFNKFAEVVVSSPNQIKSIDNQGTFSTTDNNINRNRQEQKAPPSDLGLKQRLFNDKDETSIGTMLTRLKKDNPQFAPLISAIQNGLSTKTKSWKIKLINFEDSIELNEDERASAAFYRHYDHTIYVDINAAFPIKGDKVGKADMTLLHEIIHAVTHEAITNNKQLRAQLMEMLHNARRAMIKKYGQPLESLLDPSKNQNKFYGLTDIDEFLSEAITNSFFARELANIDSVNKVSFWDQFLAWIMDVFGITKGDNAYAEVYSKLHDIINNYQQYNESLEELPVLSAADAEYEAYLQAVYGSSAMRTVKPASKNEKELREAYKQLKNDILFDKDNHTYTNRKTGKIYKPVSDVKTEVGYGEQADKLPEHAVNLGQFTAELGTVMHDALSSMLYDEFNKRDYPQLNDSVIRQLRGIVSKIKSKYAVIASEQVLADDETGIAGTADLIVRDKKTGKIILLDFKTKIRNLGDTKKSGFSYYHSSKFGRPDSDKHNFQLSMYEKLHNILGFSIDERGIIPIEYDANEDGTITKVYLTENTKGTTLESKGYYTMPHRTYIDNDIDTYVFNSNPDQVLNKIQIKKQGEIINKILETLRNKVVSLYSKGRKIQASDIENTVNEFNNLSEQEILLSYIKTAFDSLKTIIEGKNGYNERLQQELNNNNIVWNLKQLENWRDVARSFEPLTSLREYLFDYQNVFEKEVYDEILPLLDEAIKYRDILEGAYKNKGKVLWIEWITPFIKNIEGAYRLKAEREYKANHKNDFNQEDMNAYIEKYVQDNRLRIQEETKDFIEKQSNEADRDVNGFYRWVDTIFQSKDPIISGMAMAYDQMIQKTNETFNARYKQLVDLTREMEDRFAHGVTVDPKTIYDYMVETTEDGVKLISAIPEAFTKEYNRKMHEINSDEKYSTNLERFKARLKWLDENAPISDKNAYRKARKAAIKEYLDSIDITQEEYDLILKNESAYKRKSYWDLAKEGKISYKRADDLRDLSEEITWQFRKVDSSKYPNQKWDKLQELREKDPNDVRVRFFDFIQTLANEGDSYVAPRYKLNGRLPGISKSDTERFAAGQSVGTIAKERIKRGVSITSDDTEYGQYELTDETNTPVNYIPVHFTNKIKESDQSYDLPTIYKEWFKSALTYANTNEMIDQLEYTRFVVNNRNTKTGGINLASKIWKRNNPDSPIADTAAVVSDSNLAKQLNDWFDMVIYGKGTDDMGGIDLPYIGRLDARKMVDKFAKYTSLRVMGLNYISMVNNMLQAEVAQAIEVMAHKYVSPKAYSKATAEYMVEILNGSIVADVGSRKPTSKVNLLNELFGTFADYSDGSMRLSNKFSRLFNSGAFYFTTNLGEHEAQSRFLIANLIEQRAIDKDGNDIGTIYDYYTVEDGELIFDKEGKVANWGNQKRMEISARIRSQLMHMHGNYSENYRVALQRNGYLKLALMFRKWIVPSWRKRYDTLYFDNVTMDWKEGYYRTAGRIGVQRVQYFFYKLRNEAKAMEIAAVSDWSNLTEMEKQNIKRAGTEAAIMAAMWILYAALSDWDDDDNKKKGKYGGGRLGGGGAGSTFGPVKKIKKGLSVQDLIIQNIAYQAFRLKTDMGFYTNPLDMMKIVQSPIPSTSVFKGVGNLIDATFDWQPYERGPWKGHYKMEKAVYNMVPIVRQLYRARDIENEFNILNMK